MSGAATGVGSMPGTDVREAVRTVVGALEQLPHLPELPARGPGADMLGRTLGLLAELHAQVEPSGWRITDRPGRDMRRAAAWMREDLDTLEEFTQGYEGALKVQVVGPWTLAAGTELRSGEPALSDAGACRDLAASLVEGVRDHLRALARRIPGARLLLQLDEPSLPAVLAGGVPTASGYRRVPPVEAAIVQEALRGVIDAVAVAVPPAAVRAEVAEGQVADRHARDGHAPEHAGADPEAARREAERLAAEREAARIPVVVHCCARRVPVALLRRAGARGVSLDVALLSQEQDDEIAEAVESGVRLFAGAVPTSLTSAAARASAPATPSAQAGATPRPARDPLSDPAGSVSGVRALWRRIGLPPTSLATSVVVTPACGLAGADPGYARRALVHAARAAKILVDDPEG
ncbi:methionine synthase [Allostreptomyces psammosilenae]|nr:methionine synthase [Allostreptomyces psammosilenae]